MKKVIRLTESDLNRVIKRIINEKVNVRLPEGLTMDVINKYLNEEDPLKLRKMYDHKNWYFKDSVIPKMLIKGLYVDNRTFKDVTEEIMDLVKNGTLEYSWRLSNGFLMKIKNNILSSLKNWIKVPTEDDEKKFIKKYKMSELKQSLYKLLGSYQYDLTPDEINDVLINIRLNQNSGPEKFDVDPEWVFRRNKMK
jgi:hypothetical protein